MIGIVDRNHHRGNVVDHLRNGRTQAGPGDAGSGIGTAGLDVAEIEDNVIFLLKLFDRHFSDRGVLILFVVYGYVKALFFQLLDKQGRVIAAGVMIAGLIADDDHIDVLLLLGVERE